MRASIAGDYATCYAVGVSPVIARKEPTKPTKPTSVWLGPALLLEIDSVVRDTKHKRGEVIRQLLRAGLDVHFGRKPKPKK